MQTARELNRNLEGTEGIDKTEMRERVRTLNTEYSAYNSPIWKTYLDKRTQTVAKNLSKAYQQRIKKDTVNFIESRDPNKLESFLEKRYLQVLMRGIKSKSAD